MAKTNVKTLYFCTNCGNSSAKWVGKCSSCNQWNTYVEEVIDKKTKAATTPAWVSSDQSKRKAVPINIHEIEGRDDQRVKAPGQELNRVLGGGIVAGSLVLIGGDVVIVLFEGGAFSGCTGVSSGLYRVHQAGLISYLSVL